MLMIITMDIMMIILMKEIPLKDLLVVVRDKEEMTQMSALVLWLLLDLELMERDALTRLR